METILVAHDIEKTGSNLISNPIISVGFYIGDLYGNHISSHKFNIKVNWPDIVDNVVKDYGDFEPRCWNEFWSKLDIDIIESCLDNPAPLPAKDAWIAIAKFIDELEIRFPEDRYKIKFLSDNASFDTASIDYALEKYANRSPMRYSSTGEYRSVISADDMFEMLSPRKIKYANKYIDSRVKHDHDPVNDAHHMYLQYVKAIELKDVSDCYIFCREVIY